MLKTLRITSFIALAAAVCGVIAIVAFGLRGDSEILSFLAKPGVVDDAKGKIQADSGDKEDESALVKQSRLFALRIDPPPPPKPKEPLKPKDPPKSKTVVTREPPKKVVEPPRPKTRINAKFSLLATVQCADPTRSMALLKQAGGKEEWFWQGERVGHLDIDEVRDGSVVFSQDGRNPQELFVPAKPTVKSLLKGDSQPVASQTGPGSINVTLGGEPGDETTPEAALVTDPSSRPAATATDSGRVRLERSRSATEARRKVSERIRTRVAPKRKTPEEQKASIEGNISGIREIMSRDGESENEVWVDLLKALEGEKQNIEKNAEKSGDPPPAEDVEGSDESEKKPEQKPEAPPSEY